MKKNNFMSIIISHLSFLLFFVCDMIVSQCDSVIKFMYMLIVSMVKRQSWNCIDWREEIPSVYIKVMKI